jgi:hyperosmotically inducible periplasmic protein
MLVMFVSRQLTLHGSHQTPIWTEHKLVTASSVPRNFVLRERVLTMLLSRFRIVAVAAIAVLGLNGSFSATRVAAQAPDNSIQNKNTGQTADNQANAKGDRQTTAKIRKAIVGDKDLSTYAHNVKIITVNGEVTLKGPVQTDEEKQKVASLASNVVPADKIVNELTVKQ